VGRVVYAILYMAFAAALWFFWVAPTCLEPYCSQFTYWGQLASLVGIAGALGVVVGSD
jgi:hypothetical protein